MKRVTSQCSVTLTRKDTHFEEWAFFDSKSGLVLGFNLGPKKGPQIETLPCLSRGTGPVSGTVLEPVLGPQTCVELAAKFWPESGPVSHSQKIIFCDFGHRGA